MCGNCRAVRVAERPHRALYKCSMCRLPFVSAVASLCSSAVVARAPLVIYPLKTRHYDATTATNHSATTSLLLRCRRPPQPLPLPQPVCSYQATDDHRNPYLYHNQSAAIKLRTTTATPTFTTTSLQLSRCRRPPQPPLPQPVCSYRAADNHYTIGAQQGCRRRTAGVPRAHRRRTADADTQYRNTINTTNTTIPQYHNTTIPQYHNTTTQYQFTADVPQAIAI